MAEDGVYNAADDLIGRNLRAGRTGKTAFIDAAGHHSYGAVAALANRFANALAGLGIRREQRVVLAMQDSVELAACFLGAIKAGIVPVPVNTRLAPRDYRHILEDSAAAGLVVADSLLEPVLAAVTAPPPVVLVAGGDGQGNRRLAEVLDSADAHFEAAPTRADDICFWLYTSGTTGGPKGVVHLHSHLIATAENYAIPVLGIGAGDVVYSAAKLFFAYGLGNGLTFPMAVGATSVLLAGPPEPAAIAEILARHRVSLFFGVPTLYGMLLASDRFAAVEAPALRLCVSAGEALPGELLRRWRERMGVDILDGLGSTEMLHIFLSNRPGDITPGASGRPVDGYAVRLLNDDGAPCAPGELGMLEVSGPTSALMYWRQHQRTKDTFRGRWVRTGDRYTVDANGVYTYGGRADDMLKVGGIYVSPFEVEGALMRHPAVLEAAVVGHPDADALIKPKAFIVLNRGFAGGEALAEELKAFVRADLASYKYPRWISFAEALPKTATGKIQRFKLRAAG